MPVMNVSDLEGVALDWAVACAINDEQALRYGPEDFREQRRGSVDFEGNFLYRWSGNWNQGGPLIEEHRMSFDDGVADYYAVCAGGEGYGPTHLVAACRAIVSAALGDTVRAPSELTGGAQ